MARGDSRAISKRDNHLRGLTTHQLGPLNQIHTNKTIGGTRVHQSTNGCTGAARFAHNLHWQDQQAGRSCSHGHLASKRGSNARRCATMVGAGRTARGETTLQTWLSNTCTDITGHTNQGNIRFKQVKPVGKIQMTFSTHLLRLALAPWLLQFFCWS